jgi:hypothetical protein
MSDAFVPFGTQVATPAKTTEPFRVKVISADNATSVPFKAAALPQPASTSHISVHGQPQVKITRDGDKITAIRVICGCGEVMELKCAY